jgi:orotidine-5'-phosphate decarboxylase
MNAGGVYLSDKAISDKDRLIVALDVPSNAMATTMVTELGDSVTFYKIGLELFMTGEYFQILNHLLDRNKKVFVDLKFFDVPQTVGAAVRQLSERGAAFTTVHGNDAILEAACAAKGSLQILAVTVLTSLDDRDMEALGFRVPIEEVVLSRARRALELGCDGVVSSGLEAKRLRQNLGSKLLVVVPGIRPGANRPADDQKRTVDVEEAFLHGADYVVVGRPILKADRPRAVAEAIVERIRRLFGETRTP